eukprot:GDKK01026997.1.p1 GENE.GDKK01026997.1~~GDKK01026997.1.p1  ORF type:complete len:189 (+),score=6.47 GDKK01026997.1:44-610(+)
MQHDVRCDPRYTVSIIHTFNVAFLYTHVVSTIFKVISLIHVSVYDHPSCSTDPVTSSRWGALIGLLFISVFRALFRLDTIVVCEKLSEKANFRFVGGDLAKMWRRTSEILGALLICVSIGLYLYYSGNDNFEESACNLLAQAYIDFLAKSFSLCVIPGIVFYGCYIHILYGPLSIIKTNVKQYYDSFH